MLMSTWELRHQVNGEYFDFFYLKTYISLLITHILHLLKFTFYWHFCVYHFNLMQHGKIQ